jgi:hypothetical protein
MTLLMIIIRMAYKWTIKHNTIVSMKHRYMALYDYDIHDGYQVVNGLLTME